VKVQFRQLFYMAGKLFCDIKGRQWRPEGGLGVQTPPPPHEIPKALQNRVELNPIVKTVKN